MASVHIIKGSIQNIVEEDVYNRVYKPNGWQLDENYDDHIEEVLKTESKIKNYYKMKRHGNKVFNDKLLRSELDGDI